MARISTYNLDGTISDSDKVIGTDSSNTTTKNFRVQDLKEFIYSEISGNMSIAADGTASIPTSNIALGVNSGDYVASITGGVGVDSTAATSGAVTNHTLSLNLSELSTVTSISTGNKVAISPSNAGNLITVDNLFVKSPKLVSEAAVANGDYMLFLDGGATGDMKKESLSDIVTLLAGDALVASNSVLSVGVDDSTIEINSDALRVKANGITNSHINKTAITSQTDLGDAFADADTILLHDATASALREGTMAHLASYVNGAYNLRTGLAALESASGTDDEDIVVGVDSGDTIRFSGKIKVDGISTLTGNTTVTGSLTANGLAFPANSAGSNGQVLTKTSDGTIGFTSGSSTSVNDGSGSTARRVVFSNSDALLDDPDDSFVYTVSLGLLNVDNLVLGSGLSVGGHNVTDIDDNTSLGTSDVKLATQRAIKTYVDAQVDSADTLGELNDVTLTSAANHSMLLYNGSDWIDNVMSGDATMANTGVITVGTAAIATTITVADESSDTTCFPVFVTAATGNLAPKSGSNLAFNSSSGALTAANFVTTSDKRLKSDIEPIKEGIEIIKKFSSYTYIKDGEKESGFIAQEVKEVIPHIVYENNEGMLSMSDRGVLAHMHKAIIQLEERLVVIEEKLK